MTTRILSPNEWPKLHGTELETVIPHLRALRADVVAVEQEETVVGAWALYPTLRVEGVWIHPAHRGRGRVAAHLLHGMQTAARDRGMGFVVTGALTGQVRGLITHLGGHALPGEQFVIPIPGV